MSPNVLDDCCCCRLETHADMLCDVCGAPDHPEVLLVCSKCRYSAHRQCVGLDCLSEDVEAWTCSGCSCGSPPAMIPASPDTPCNSMQKQLVAAAASVFAGGNSAAARSLAGIWQGGLPRWPSGLKRPHGFQKRSQRSTYQLVRQVRELRCAAGSKGTGAVASHQRATPGFDCSGEGETCYIKLCQKMRGTCRLPEKHPGFCTGHPSYRRKAPASQPQPQPQPQLQPEQQDAGKPLPCASTPRELSARSAGERMGPLLQPMPQKGTALQALLQAAQTSSHGGATAASVTGAVEGMDLLLLTATVQQGAVDGWRTWNPPFWQ